MAICAICQGALTHAQRFLITDQAEVVHRSCVRPGRTTIGQRLRQDLASARQEAASAHVALTNALREIASLRAQSTADHEVAEESRRDRAQMTRQLAQARRERDAARREAALHQTIGPRPATTPNPTTTDATEDTRDPTVVRFSLLDLT